MESESCGGFSEFGHVVLRPWMETWRRERVMISSKEQGVGAYLMNLTTGASPAFLVIVSSRSSVRAMCGISLRKCILRRGNGNHYFWSRVGECLRSFL